MIPPYNIDDPTKVLDVLGDGYWIVSHPSQMFRPDFFRAIFRMIYHGQYGKFHSFEVPETRAGREILKQISDMTFIKTSKHKKRDFWWLTEDDMMLMKIMVPSILDDLK